MILGNVTESDTIISAIKTADATMSAAELAAGMSLVTSVIAFLAVIGGAIIAGNYAKKTTAKANVLQEKIARELNDLQEKIAQETNDLQKQLAQETNILQEKLANETNALQEKLTQETNELTSNLGLSNLESQEHRRFIDTISNERVKWINNVREKFSDYNRYSYLYANFVGRLKRKEVKEDENTTEYNFHFADSVYHANMIELYLNPSEVITEKLIKIQNEIILYFQNAQRNLDQFDYLHFKSLLDKLSLYQQIVLKTEWKIVKEETEKGEELTDIEKRDLTLKIAKKISEEIYNEIDTVI